MFNHHSTVLAGSLAFSLGGACGRTDPVDPPMQPPPFERQTLLEGPHPRGETLHIRCADLDSEGRFVSVVVNQPGGSGEGVEDVFVRDLQSSQPFRRVAEIAVDTYQGDRCPITPQGWVAFSSLVPIHTSSWEPRGSGVFIFDSHGRERRREFVPNEGRIHPSQSDDGRVFVYGLLQSMGGRVRSSLAVHVLGGSDRTFFDAAWPEMSLDGNVLFYRSSEDAMEGPTRRYHYFNLVTGVGGEILPSGAAVFLGDVDRTGRFVSLVSDQPLDPQYPSRVFNAYRYDVVERRANLVSLSPEGTLETTPVLNVAMSTDAACVAWTRGLPGQIFVRRQGVTRRVSVDREGRPEPTNVNLWALDGSCQHLLYSTGDTLRLIGLRHFFP